MTKSKRSFARRLGVEENATFEERKLIVLREAARAFEENGVHQTSLEEIARRLNVSRQTVYHYLNDKDGIVVECMNIGKSLLESSLSEAHELQINGLEKLRYVFRRYAAIVTDELGRCLVTLDINALKIENQKAFHQMQRDLLKQIRGFIEDGIADGSIRKQNPDIAMFALTYAFASIGFWYRSGGRLNPVTIAEGFMDLFENGLATGGKNGG